MSDGPIFLVGLAYSGKTPLRIALGVHPDLSLTRGSHLWDRWAGRLPALETDGGLDRALATLADDPGVRRLDPDLDALRDTFATGPRTEARLFTLLHAQHAARAGARRWGEQCGPLERHAETIFATFPGAKMLHLLRDPLERYAASPHRGAAAVRREASAWRRSAARAARGRATLPGGYLVVRYEDLAARPVATLEEVAAFVGERCTDEMREAIATRLDAAVRPGAGHGRRVSPLAGVAIRRWTASARAALDDREQPPAASATARTEAVR